MDRQQLAWLFTSFSGRINRRAYAWAGAFLYLLRFFPVYKIIGGTDDPQANAFWATMLLVVVGVTLVPHMALAAKRLHDFGRPGWFAALFIVGDVFMYLALALIPGQPGANRYGRATNEPART